MGEKKEMKKMSRQQFAAFIFAVSSILLLVIVLIFVPKDSENGAKRIEKVEKMKSLIATKDYDEAIKISKKIKGEEKDNTIEIFKNECESVKQRYIAGEIDITDSSMILDKLAKIEEVGEVSKNIKNDISKLAQEKLEASIAFNKGKEAEQNNEFLTAYKEYIKVKEGNENYKIAQENIKKLENKKDIIAFKNKDFKSAVGNFYTGVTLYAIEKGKMEPYFSIVNTGDNVRNPGGTIIKRGILVKEISSGDVYWKDRDRIIKDSSSTEEYVVKYYMKIDDPYLK